MRTNYLTHLANILGLQWSTVGLLGGGQLPVKLVNLL